MIPEWLNDPASGKYAVLITLLVFGAIEFFAGHYKGTKRTKDDWIMEFLGFFLLSLNSFVVLFGIIYLGKQFLPDAYNSLSTLTLWLAVPLYMFVDDIMQYWYHRSAHEYDWLWKHHRPHHAAEEMGVMVSFRNSFLYFLFLPNVWWAAICTFLGMIPATVIGLIIKQLVVTSTHSTFKWDEYLYRIKFLSPLVWVIERIFVTPAFHYAHHGKSKADKISDPNGNFGNAFSIWDQLFGTATFTRKFPTEFGLQTDPKDDWTSHLFYPFVTSKKEGSEIGKDFKRTSTATKDAITMELEAGTHLWCQCGFSKNQPFCDGAHHGTKFTPIAFDVKKKRKVKLCNCKHTKTGPFCDNTHLEL
jgi:sterol desaturase/sphingolipid hydroxylase (fatty acid hydroxylase superfamily)/CDGSH-type Zn-finger protein